MPTIIFKTLPGRKHAGLSVWDAIKSLTFKEMLQGLAELATIGTAIGGGIYWLTPLLQQKPNVQIGIAFYAYERGFTLDGKTKQTLFQMRNLVSNCNLWGSTLPSKSAKIIEVHSWVLSKFLLKNESDKAITNLRMGVRSPLLQLTTRLVATPNVEATGKLESTSNDALHTYVISIPVIAPKASAVLSLETPVDEKMHQFLYVDHGKSSVLIPFLSADQIEMFQPQMARINAMELVVRESQIRTGEKTFADEKIEITILGSDEVDRNFEDVSFRRLPPAVVCVPGTGGNW